ncbi:hypothetical protein [Streptomyces sp. NRRL B-24484]|uniref:hypothetical protein n=1 Tax=Streptomyces sp. NRRL B-24484 TaxID=1463833 RepID=UPI0007C5B899|nr:hypothetical protein [Streptomyces sp. NRRL B-24484]
MYLTYKPEGSEEPRRWKYEPKKLMSAEREAIEKRTDRNYAQFVGDVQQGSSICRRALLWVMLKREHPALRFDDVDFAWDELDFEYSKAELQEFRRDASEQAPSGQRDAILAQLDKEIAEAFEEDEGKAPQPSAASGASATRRTSSASARGSGSA